MTSLKSFSHTSGNGICFLPFTSKLPPAPPIRSFTPRPAAAAVEGVFVPPESGPSSMVAAVDVSKGEVCRVLLLAGEGERVFKATEGALGGSGEEGGGGAGGAGGRGRALRVSLTVVEEGKAGGGGGGEEARREGGDDGVGVEGEDSWFLFRDSLSLILSGMSLRSSASDVSCWRGREGRDKFSAQCLQSFAGKGEQARGDEAARRRPPSHTAIRKSDPC